MCPKTNKVKHSSWQNISSKSFQAQKRKEKKF